MSQGRRALVGTAMVATRAIDTIASTVFSPRSRAGSRDIGGRLSLARLRPGHEVGEVIAHITAVLAVERSAAMDPHFLERVLGESDPRRCFPGVRNGFSSEFFLFSAVIDAPAPRIPPINGNLGRHYQGCGGCLKREIVEREILERANAPPGGIGAGRCGWRRSVAVGLAAAGPDQAEGLAVLVVEEVGVDRSVEARIVQLDREIIAALAGALRPRCSDFNSASINPVAARRGASPRTAGGTGVTARAPAGRSLAGTTPTACRRARCRRRARSYGRGDDA
jgi:hypothetical protein